jgi:toxin CcdB
MRQFDLYRNPDPPSARRRPYLIVLQSDLLEVMETVVVAPLARAKTTMPIKRLTPVVEIGGHQYLVLVHEMAAIPRQELRKRVESAASLREALTAALDLVFFGF